MYALVGYAMIAQIVADVVGVHGRRTGIINDPDPGRRLHGFGDGCRYRIPLIVVIPGEQQPFLLFEFGREIHIILRPGNKR